MKREIITEKKTFGEAGDGESAKKKQKKKQKNSVE